MDAYFELGVMILVVGLGIADPVVTRVRIEMKEHCSFMVRSRESGPLGVF